MGEVSPDDPITSALWNDMWQQIILQCTSTTRPTDATAGRKIYETDTLETLEYQNSTVGWTRPWRTPWGRMGLGVDNGLHTPLSGATVVAACDPFDTVANRLHRISFRACYVGHGDSPDGSNPIFAIYRGVNGADGTAIGAAEWSQADVPSEVNLMAVDWTTDQTTEAGTYIYYLVASSVDGTYIDVRGDIAVTEIFVEDTGPGFSPSDVPET